MAVIYLLVYTRKLRHHNSCHYVTNEKCDVDPWDSDLRYFITSVAVSVSKGIRTAKSQNFKTTKAL